MKKTLVFGISAVVISAGIAMGVRVGRQIIDKVKAADEE